MVGVAGGDGSLGVVADLVSGAGVQMVCIPAGTRNHFAMDLGLDRGGPVAALDAFGPARLQTVDITGQRDGVSQQRVHGHLRRCCPKCELPRTQT